MYEKIFGEAFAAAIPPESFEAMRQRFYDRYIDHRHCLIRLTEAQDPFFGALEENMAGYDAIETPTVMHRRVAGPGHPVVAAEEDPRHRSRTRAGSRSRARVTWSISRARISSSAACAASSRRRAWTSSPRGGRRVISRLYPCPSPFPIFLRSHRVWSRHRARKRTRKRTSQRQARCLPHKGAPPIVEQASSLLEVLTLEVT